MELASEIHQLFPTEDINLFYIPHSKGESNENLSARGSLYNYYKLVRKDLRTAGTLLIGNKPIQAKSTYNEEDFLNCTTDVNVPNCTLATKLKLWYETHEKRISLLSHKENKKKYFDT